MSDTFGKGSLSRIVAVIFDSKGQDAPKPSDQLLEHLEQSSRPGISFYLMLGMATAIASLGLLSNSAPAIIGAMIVAPLMSPIIGLSFASLLGERDLALRSVASIVSGVMVVIAISYACTVVVGLRVVGSEIVARTAPSTLDLMVALCSGAAAAFAHARTSISSSIAGVAIAVALVPPLSVVGIGLALGSDAISAQAIALSDLHHQGNGVEMASGAFLLFFTNLLGIVGAAILLFGLQGYGHWRKPFAIGACLAIASLFVVNKLDRRLDVIYVEDLVKGLYVEAVNRNLGIVSEDAYVWQVRGERLDGHLNVSIVMLGLKKNMDRAKESQDAFRRMVSEEIGEEVSLKFEIIPIEVFLIESRPEVALTEGMK